jgi:hypothetical protein
MERTRACCVRKFRCYAISFLLPLLFNFLFSIFYFLFFILLSFSFLFFLSFIDITALFMVPVHKKQYTCCRSFFQPPSLGSGYRRYLLGFCLPSVFEFCFLSEKTTPQRFEQFPLLVFMTNLANMKPVLPLADHVGQQRWCR